MIVLINHVPMRVYAMMELITTHVIVLKIGWDKTAQKSMMLVVLDHAKMMARVHLYHLLMTTPVLVT